MKCVTTYSQAKMSDKFLLYLIIRTVTCYPISPKILILISNFKNISVISFKMLVIAVINVSNNVSI